jgi:hypothetical protein
LFSLVVAEMENEELEIVAGEVEHRHDSTLPIDGTL